MRATSTPAKRRTRGIASAMIMSAVVGFSILGSGTALAGNTSKQVYFGSGPTGSGAFQMAPRSTTQ